MSNLTTIDERSVVVKKILATLINSDRTKEENEQYLLEFVKVRLFRIWDNVSGWRYYRCMMDSKIKELVKDLSQKYDIPTFCCREILYCERVLDIKRKLSTGEKNPRYEDDFELFEKIVNSMKNSFGGFPVFVRISLCMNIADFELLTKDFYTLKMLSTPS